MNIISRAQWGARPARSRQPVTWREKGTLWVHYTWSAVPADSRAAEAQAIREIQAGHMAQGWADIGYNYLIAPHSGRIYEGRGANVVGAHCPGKNTEPGVALLWMSGTQLPPKVALQSVQDIGVWLRQQRLAGHREAYPTACPGDAIMAWIRANRILPQPGVLNLDRDAYLRLDINGRTYTGWRSNLGRLRWIARNGLKTNQTGIAWRGPGRSDTNTWRGRTDVRNVARSLTTKYGGK